MAKSAKSVVNAVRSGDFGSLPKDFTKTDARDLFKEDKIDDDQFDAVLDHLMERGKKPQSQTAELKMKVGEKGWFVISSGFLGVGPQKPLVMKGNTLMALLTHHREELLEFCVDAMDGEYDTEVRKGQKGDYTVLTKNDVVVGSAGTNDQITRAKGILDHCLKMVS